MIDENDMLDLLPRLRHHARALTGSRVSGDDLLLAAVRSLDLLRVAASTRPDTVLFQGLFEAWLRSRPPSGQECANPSGSEDARPFDRRFSALNPLARQAFLLVALERFTLHEASAVMKMHEHAFAQLYERAERQLLDAVLTDVLIIEDDAFISADLERIMENIGHTVAGIAATCQQAIHLAARQKPGLILCDIALADGSSGLNAVNAIIGRNDIPVVYVTANPDQLPRDEIKNGDICISKPYSAAQIRDASNRALFFTDTGHGAQLRRTPRPWM